MFFGQDRLVALGELGKLLLQGRESLDFLFQLRLHARPVCPWKATASAALFCNCWFSVWRLACATANCCCRLGLLLLKLLRLLVLGLDLLLEGLHLFFALAQQRLLLADLLAGSSQFPDDLLAAFAFLIQGQPHHRGEVFAGIRELGWWPSSSLSCRWAF